MMARFSKFLLLTLILISLIFIPMLFIDVQVLVADPTSTPSTSTRPSRESSAIEIAEWEVEMAESGYSFNKSVKSRSSLVTALEKLITLRCYPDYSRTLEHSGDSLTPECLSAIKKLETIYPHNPASTCARTGMDSPDCAKAYSHQLVGSIEDTPIPKWKNADTLKYDLSVELLDASSRDKISKLTRNVSVGSSRTLTPELIEERESNMADALQLACANHKIVLINSTDGEISKRAQTGGKTPLMQKKKKETIEDFVKAHSQPSPTPEPDPSGYTRWRIVSKDCKKLVQTAKKNSVGTAVATCSWVGKFTPQCADALKAEKARRKKKDPIKPSASTSSEGQSSLISEF